MGLISQEMTRTRIFRCQQDLSVYHCYKVHGLFWERSSRQYASCNWNCCQLQRLWHSGRFSSNTTPTIAAFLSTIFDFAVQSVLAILQLCQGSFQRLPSLFQAWVALCGWTLDFWNASHALQTLVGCHFCYKVTSELQTIVVMYIIRWVKTLKQVVRNRMLLGLLSRSCWLDYSKRMIRYCIEPIFRQGLDFCVLWVVYSRDPRVARLALGMEVGEGAIWRQSCAPAAFSLKIHKMSFLELYITMVYYIHPHI